MYYTYILRNYITSRYYVRFTPDLKNRLQKHKSGKVLSTKSNLNYELEWYCAFKTKAQALMFEKYLKTGSGVAFMKKRFFKSPVALAKRYWQGIWLLEAIRRIKLWIAKCNPCRLTILRTTGGFG